MPNAIQILDSRNLTIGRAKLGRRGDGIGSVKQQVHDGDTITVRADGNFGVRLLGIDTPEIQQKRVDEKVASPRKDAPVSLREDQGGLERSFFLRNLFTIETASSIESVT